MTRARHALGPIAAVWLACQAATLTLVPTLIDIDLAECQCPIGADASCPMHHGPAAGSRVCVMHGLTTGDVSMLNSLLGLAGFLPAPTVAIVQMTAEPLIRFERSLATWRTAPPDPPPPRT